MPVVPKPLPTYCRIRIETWRDVDCEPEAAKRLGMRGAHESLRLSQAPDWALRRGKMEQYIHDAYIRPWRRDICDCLCAVFGAEHQLECSTGHRCPCSRHARRRPPCGPMCPNTAKFTASDPDTKEAPFGW